VPSICETEFVDFVSSQRPEHPGATLAVPVGVRLLADQLTPVLAYRRLVSADERTAPSFMLESVEGGERQGRHSILGADPAVEVVAFGHAVTITDRRTSDARRTERQADPMSALREISQRIRVVVPTGAIERKELPACPLGGWFGYASYDTVRYAEPEKLHARNAPPDDRRLPDLHFGLYPGVVAFDNVDKLVHVVQLALVDPDDDPAQAYRAAVETLESRVRQIQTHVKPLASGRFPPSASGEAEPLPSNTTRDEHRAMVERAKEYIRAGDIFQVVLGQRFERSTSVDPFDVYRALRAVNPSPYMVYLQAAGTILVASSPEILCRVRDEGTVGDPRMIVTNRPLAGTRRRGRSAEEDAALERELLADAKERAEHVMLVDLGRNDVGRVCQPGTIELSDVMSIERYSHVMHISSTVTGELRADLDCWDALRAALPVGTISGAPKIRAMQIIDELEKVRRGPYGGGMGWVGLDGQMDIALALRTIVVPTDLYRPDTPSAKWTYHVQAAGGIVADSDADAEFMETVNKAAALGRAIDVAESAFSDPEGG